MLNGQLLLAVIARMERVHVGGYWEDQVKSLTVWMVLVLRGFHSMTKPSVHL